MSPRNRLRLWEYGATDAANPKIAPEVRAITLPPSVYGQCYWRAALGQPILERHGIAANPVLGPIAHKGGPQDELRYMDDHGRASLAGPTTRHFWLSTGRRVIDSSPARWPVFLSPAAVLKAFRFVWCDRTA